MEKNSQKLSQTLPVLIVGGGAAGLRAAQTLLSQKVPFLLFEGKDHLGGRIQTERVEGFLLDRGFQVLQTTYPELSQSLDLGRLDLNYFAAGARIWDGKRFHRISDPLRCPWDFPETLLAPVGSIWDKWLIGLLKWTVLRLGEEGVWNLPNISTLEYLRRFGFSQRIIDRFFRPFLGGVFLETDLATPAPFFGFVFRHFSLGRVALPRAGMGAVAQEMARKLPLENLRLGCQVVRAQVETDRITVVCANGERHAGRGLILASAAEISLIQSDQTPWVPPPASWKGVVTHWFASPTPVKTGPYLILNATGKGPINHAAVMTEVCPDYGPEGQSLIGLSEVGPNTTDRHAVQDHARDMFGPQAAQWRWLRTDSISHALPSLPGKSSAPPPDPPVRCAGDRTTHPSLQGALISGRESALWFCQNAPLAEPG